MRLQSISASPFIYTTPLALRHLTIPQLRSPLSITRHRDRGPGQTGFGEGGVELVEIAEISRHRNTEEIGVERVKDKVYRRCNLKM